MRARLDRLLDTNTALLAMAVLIMGVAGAGIGSIAGIVAVSLGSAL